MDSPSAKNTKIYKTVKIATLPTGRRGKHRDLTDGILRELKEAKEGMALVIPLVSVSGVEMSNLRSAVHRAATAENLVIETQADEKNFYVWRRNGSGHGNGRE